MPFRQGGFPVRRRPVEIESLEPRALLSAGQLDPSFGGGDGMVTRPGAGSGTDPVAVAMQPDGKSVAAGFTRSGINPADFVVERFNPDGSLDTTFGANGRVVTDFRYAGHGYVDDGPARDAPSSIFVQGDGKIVVAGTTGPVDHYSGAIAVARYNPDGSPDATFDGDGRVVIGLGNGVGADAAAPAPGGKIVLACQVWHYPNSNDFAVLRLDADGSPDATFGAGGWVVSDSVGRLEQYNSVAVRPDGKVVLAGFAQADPLGDAVVRRLNPDGTPDASFGAGGDVHFDDLSPHDLLILPNGQILLSYGQLAQPSESYSEDLGVTRLNANGTVDATYGDAGRRLVALATNDQPAALVDGRQGRALLLIQRTTGATTGMGTVARLTPGGDLDTAFGGGDGLADIPTNPDFGWPVDLAVQPSGLIVALGFPADRDFGSHPAMNRAALTPAGDPAPFVATDPVPDPHGLSNEFLDVVPLPGGKLLVTGGAYLARFNADGSFDPAFGVDGIASESVGGDFTRLAVAGDGKIVGFGSVLARFNPDGTPDATFGGGDGVVTPSSTGDGLALQPDGKILTVEGNDVGAVVARYNRDGSIDITFGDNGHVAFDHPIGRAPWSPTGEPYSGFIPTDVAWRAATGRIVVGGNTPGSGLVSDFAVARLLPDGTLDTTFGGGTGLSSVDSGDIDYGYRMDVAPDGRIALAGAEDGGDADVVLFDPDGARPSVTELPWLGEAHDVAFAPDAKVVVAGDGEVPDPETGDLHHDLYVARLTAAGGIDTSFASPDVSTDVFGLSDDRARAVAVTPAGDVLVAGNADNSPVLLKYQGGPLNSVGIVQAYLRSSAWVAPPGAAATPFVRYLAERQLGNSLGFLVRDLLTTFRVPPDTTLPWINLDEVVVRFTGPLPGGAPHPADVTIDGTRSPYTVTAVTPVPSWPDTYAFRLDRPLGALPGGGNDGDRLTVHVIGAGSETSFPLNVLQADADRAGGRVNALDLGFVKARLNRTSNDPPAAGAQYTPFADANGDGRINAIDLGAVKARLNHALPPAVAAAAPFPLETSTSGRTRDESVAAQVLRA